MASSIPQAALFDDDLVQGANVRMAMNTILHSSHVKYIVSAQFALGQYPSVILIKEYIISVYALDKKHRLEYLDSSNEFPERILSACVVRNASMLESNGKELLDVLVLTLEDYSVHFMAACTNDSDKLEFLHEVWPVPVGQDSAAAFGRHVAVHNPDLIAISYSSKHMCFVKLHDPDALEEMAPGGGLQSLSLQETPEMKILNMDFFHSPETTKDRTSLACLASLEGRLKLVVFSWSTLRGYHDIKPETYILALDSFVGIPQVFCPLVANPNAIFMADESQMIIYSFHQHDPVQLEFRVATGEILEHTNTALNKFSSCEPPLWSSCVLSAISKTIDHLYLVNENGVVLGLVIQPPQKTSRIQVNNHEVLGFLGSRIDTAITVFQPNNGHIDDATKHEDYLDHHEAEDKVLEIIVFVGDGGDGGLWKIERPASIEVKDDALSKFARKMTKVETIFNWAPLTDATLRTDTWLSQRLHDWSLNHRQGYQRANELFATCGKDPYGGVLQLRTGYSISVDSYAEVQGLEEIEGIWALLYPDNNMFVASFPYGSLLLQNIHSDAQPRADRISDEPTLCAFPIFDELDSVTRNSCFVQVTSTGIYLVNIETVERYNLIESDIWGSPATRAYVNDERTLLLSLHPEEGEKTRVRFQKLGNHLQQPAFSYITDSYDVEIVCACHVPSTKPESGIANTHPVLYEFLDRHFVVLGNIDGEIIAYSVTPELHAVDDGDHCKKYLRNSSPVHSIQVVQETSAKQFSYVLHCAHRDGTVVSARLNLLEKDHRISSDLTEVRSFEIPLSLQSASHDSSDAISIVDSKIFLFQLHESLGSEIDQVVLTDKADPGFCAGRVFAVCALGHQLRRGKGMHRLLCVAQDRIFTGYLQPGPGFLTRRIRIPGTPNRILHSARNQLLLVASTVVEVDYEINVRYIQSVLYLVDPASPSMETMPNIARNYREVFRCKPGQIITSLLDWTVSTEQGKYNAVVAGTKDSEHSVESGSVLIFKLKRRGTSHYTLELQKTVKEARPVYTVCEGTQESLLYACGNEVKYRRWTIGEKESEKGTLLDLASPAISMSLRHPNLYVATTSASAMAYSMRTLFLTNLLVQEDQARACLSQVPVVAAESTTDYLLVSDQNRRLALLPIRAPCKAAVTVSMHSAITKLLAQPPWDDRNGIRAKSCRIIVGVSADGSVILTTTLLAPKFCKLFKFLLNLLEQDVRICPSQTMKHSQRRRQGALLNFDILEQFVKLEDPKKTLLDILHRGPQSTLQGVMSGEVGGKTHHEAEHIQTHMLQLLADLGSKLEEKDWEGRVEWLVNNVKRALLDRL